MAAYPRATAEVRRIMLAEPLTPMPAARSWSSRCRAIGAEEMGEPVDAARGAALHRCPPLRGRGDSDVIYGAGPHDILEANAHNADEHLRLDDLRRATRVVARTLAELLSPA